MFPLRPALSAPLFFRVIPALLAALAVVTPARAQTQSGPAPVMLSVVARDPLPGFRRADEIHYLADQMKASGVRGWGFAAAQEPSIPARDRIEWHFELDPYAGGGIRQFFPIPGVQRLFGARHLITAEAMLFLDDEYQTLFFGQATIHGGAQDKDLAGFIARMSEGLLGEKGAYCSIDMGKPRTEKP